MLKQTVSFLGCIQNSCARTFVALVEVITVGLPIFGIIFSRFPAFHFIENSWHFWFTPGIKETFVSSCYMTRGQSRVKNLEENPHKVFKALFPTSSYEPN